MKTSNKKTQYITPKKEDIERRFDEYNEKYFDGVLQKCKISVTKSKYNAYAFICKYSSKVNKIYIANDVYWTDENLKLTLIHEMVHHYVWEIMNLNPFFVHGTSFRKVCRMLRKKHGLRVNLWELPSDHWKGKRKASPLKEMMLRFLSFVLPL